MKKTKRIVLLVLAVVVLLLAAYAGKTVLDLKNSAATEVQEEDSTRWAELTSDPLTLEGIADGSAKYASAAVNDSTYYFKTDGQNYRCVISGLDPAASYRLTISYDSSRYYLYGGLKVEGIAA